MRLIDHASRAAALARSLIDGDNGSRDVGAGFKPSPSALRDRLRADLAVRRRRRDESDAPAVPEPPPELPPDDAPPRPPDPNFDPEWRDVEPISTASTINPQRMTKVALLAAGRVPDEQRT